MTDDKLQYPIITYVAKVYSYNEAHKRYDTDLTHKSFTCEQAAHLKYTEYLGNATGHLCADKEMAFDDKLPYLITLQKHCRQSDDLEGYVSIDSYYAEGYKLGTVE